MKKTLAILLGVCLFACNFKQELSETDKLFLTAKIWGFLKYYHPEVNKGQLNWDDELVEILHQLPSIRDKKELNALYMDWIKSLGKVAPKEGPALETQGNHFDENFDLSWFSHEALTPALTDQLRYIEQNRSLEQHYVKRGPVGQIEIVHEPNYTASQWNNPDIRLVMLFRYWNVIEYFYPYKYKTDVAWDQVLLNFIPRSAEVTTELDYHLLLHELTVSLCDSHAFFVTDLVRAHAGNKYIAARFKILDGNAVITQFYDDSLASVDDIRLGDKVTMVNHVPVADLYATNVKYITGSNPAVKQLDYSFRWIFNGDTDTVNITFERNGSLTSKTIRRYPRSQFRTRPAQPVKWKKLEGNIGYLNMEEIQSADLPDLMKDLWSTKALIIDLRNYPEFIIDELLGYLNPEPKPFAIFIQPDLTYPGRFVWTEPVECGKHNPNPYQGRVIVLVNEETQSRSEYFVMALQTVKGAITVGRQTSGADGDVLDFTFYDDKTSWITGRGVFYPDGRETQRIGIVPDVIVPLTLEGIANGRDEILEKALQVAR